MSGDALAGQDEHRIPPEARLIDLCDTAAAGEAFLAVGRDPQGFQESYNVAAEIAALYGDDAVQLLEESKGHSFFFGDSEDRIVQQPIDQLRQGHFVMGVPVLNRDHAQRLSTLAQLHGGSDFSYFGTWVTEKLPTDREHVGRLFGSQRALRSIEDFTEFEQRAAYFDGDPVIAVKKGVNPLDRGSPVHAMAEFQELLDFSPPGNQRRSAVLARWPAADF